MATNDITNNIKVVPAIAPVVLTDNTATTPITVDTLGFKSASFAILTGALADADATFAVEVTESDDDSTYTAVADGDHAPLAAVCLLGDPNHAPVTLNA